jgi:hypothetical protein
VHLLQAIIELLLPGLRWRKDTQSSRLKRSTITPLRCSHLIGQHAMYTLDPAAHLTIYRIPSLSLLPVPLTPPAATAVKAVAFQTNFEVSS